MKTQIPDLKEAKIVRVDKQRNILYVWESGDIIHAFNLHTGKFLEDFAVRTYANSPFSRNTWISFTEVKQRMRELIGGAT